MNSMNGIGGAFGKSGVPVMDLQRVGPAFRDPAIGSQTVFRSALQALSYPGRLQTVADVGDWPKSAQRLSSLLMLALVDSDCAVWISPSLQVSDAAHWLRFHTGCQWVDDLADARFIWVAQQDLANGAMPALDDLSRGTDEYPDESATCVIEVAGLHSLPAAAGNGWQLTGPGISGAVQLHVEGAPDDFADQWGRNHAVFPRGVDAFLTARDAFIGLPRTTRIEQKGSC